MMKQLSGSDNARVAEQLRVLSERRNAWPYPHLFPPPGSNPVHQIGFPVAVPAPSGTNTVLVSYEVPVWQRFYLTAILADCEVPGGFVPGDLLFNVWIGNIATGILDWVNGLAAIPIPMGRWSTGVKWWFDMPYDFDSNQIINLGFTNVNLAQTVSTPVIGGLFGFTVPKAIPGGGV